jgi:hypothetical protein
MAEVEIRDESIEVGETAREDEGLHKIDEFVEKQMENWPENPGRRPLEQWMVYSFQDQYKKDGKNKHKEWMIGGKVIPAEITDAARKFQEDHLSKVQQIVEDFLKKQQSKGKVKV